VGKGNFLISDVYVAGICGNQAIEEPYCIYYYARSINHNMPIQFNLILLYSRGVKTLKHYKSVILCSILQIEYPGTREYLKKNTRKFEYLEIEYFGITTHAFLSMKSKGPVDVSPSSRFKSPLLGRDECPRQG